MADTEQNGLLGRETPEHVCTAGHSMSAVTEAKHRQEMCSFLVQSPRKEGCKAEAEKLAFARKKRGGVILGGN